MLSIIAQSLRIASRTETPQEAHRKLEKPAEYEWLPPSHWWLKRNQRLPCGKGARAGGCAELH